MEDARPPSYIEAVPDSRKEKEEESVGMGWTDF